MSSLSSIISSVAQTQASTIAAVIQEGQVNPDDSNARYSQLSYSTSLSIFTDYVIQNRYESDRHIYQMGITSPGGFQGASVAFVQLASPTLLWIADWTAARYNEIPPIPNPVLSDSNWILLDQHLELGNLEYGPDGVTPLYRISGTYIYGHQNPSSQLINNVTFGLSPEYVDIAARTVPASTLMQGIINQTAGGPVSATASTIAAAAAAAS